MMEKEHRDYGVVILNYNSADDAIKAGRMLVENAKDRSYVICFVDNCSSIDGELAKIKNENIPNAEYIQIKSNRGYASGNNDGIRFIESKYIVDYIVIMNPDVFVHILGTIDNLINILETNNDKYYGISPLIKGRDLAKDQHFNKVGFVVPSYFELLILNTAIFKFLFYKKFKRCTYLNLTPYKSNFEVEAVQGGFFVMKASKFREIGYFDERTFLYGEERIIGFKVKEKGGSFLVSVDNWVQHIGGSSTKIEPKKAETIRSVVLHLDADIVYLENYLHVNVILVMLYRLLVMINFVLKKTIRLIYK